MVAQYCHVFRSLPPPPLLVDASAAATLLHRRCRRRTPKVFYMKARARKLSVNNESFRTTSPSFDTEVLSNVADVVILEETNVERQCPGLDRGNFIDSTTAIHNTGGANATPSHPRQRVSHSELQQPVRLGRKSERRMETFSDTNVGLVRCSSTLGFWVPELATNLCRTYVATAPSQSMPQAPLLHIVVDQAHPYASIGYHMMQQHPSQIGVTMVNQGYEYSDPSQQPQMYYTQNAPPTMYTSQNQTMASAPMILDIAAASEMQHRDVKQTRVPWCLLG